MKMFIDSDLEEQYGEQLYQEYLGKENNQMKKDITTMNEEIERLNNIIKKAKEYIEEMNVWCIEFENFGVESKKLLEILDSLEEDESPYCEVCGTCGDIECCGIRDFIEHHIKGKTNCKNEQDIIYELIDLCDYKDEVFKENEKLKEIIKEVREYIETKYDYLLGDDTFLDHDERIDGKQIKHILGILGSDKE